MSEDWGNGTWPDRLLMRGLDAPEISVRKRWEKALLPGNIRAVQKYTKVIPYTVRVSLSDDRRATTSHAQTTTNSTHKNSSSINTHSATAVTLLILCTNHTPS